MTYVNSKKSTLNYVNTKNANARNTQKIQYKKTKLDTICQQNKHNFQLHFPSGTSKVKTFSNLGNIIP